MTRGRRLDSRDVGRVFFRVDRNGTPGEYLYLSDLGPGPTVIASFIRFRMTDGIAQEVGTMGYHNGSWYQEVPGFSEAFLADIRARHDEHFEGWHVELKRTTAEKAELRARLGKPESWSPLGEGRTGGTVSDAYVIWYNSDAFTYEIEVYGHADQLLASRTLECSHEPRFGIDVLDHDRVFGEPGELSRLIDGVEE